MMAPREHDQEAPSDYKVLRRYWKSAPTRPLRVWSQRKRSQVSRRNSISSLGPLSSSRTPTTCTTRASCTRPISQQWFVAVESNYIVGVKSANVCFKSQTKIKDSNDQQGASQTAMCLQSIQFILLIMSKLSVAISLYSLQSETYFYK